MGVAAARFAADTTAASIVLGAVHGQLNSSRITRGVKNQCTAVVSTVPARLVQLVFSDARGWYLPLLCLQCVSQVWRTLSLLFALSVGALLWSTPLRTFSVVSDWLKFVYYEPNALEYACKLYYIM